MSISKAQANALADGFLDGLGSEKDDLKPRETLSELFLLAGELVESAQQNLIRNKSVATGNLSASLIVDEPVHHGNITRTDILMNQYGRFVNKGVKGRKGGNGLYSFKHDHPSNKMVNAIRDWMKQGKAKVSNIKKPVSKLEKKNSSISEISSAYAVAQSIVNKGIKGTGFLDKAIIKTQSKVKDRLGAALKIDIVNGINNI